MVPSINTSFQSCWRVCTVYELLHYIAQQLQQVNDCGGMQNCSIYMEAKVDQLSKVIYLHFVLPSPMTSDWKILRYSFWMVKKLCSCKRLGLWDRCLHFPLTYKVLSNTDLCIRDTAILRTAVLSGCFHILSGYYRFFKNYFSWFCTILV